jgi:tRNA1(Val) A37 N6-methylase TrmN6
MELRGSVVDYAERAASLLTDDGVFVVCFAGQDPRAEEALQSAGLNLLIRQDVIFRADLPPTITVLAGQKSACETLRPPAILIRDKNSQFTAEYMAMRHRLDAPI